MSSLLAAAATVGMGRLVKLKAGELVAIARIIRNMRSTYTDAETMAVLKALFLGGTRQDMRDAWAVLDRRKVGALPREEVEVAIVDILGGGVAAR